MDVPGDAVLGLVDRSRLSLALTAIHRAGQGHHARVLDSARGDLGGQLTRAGVTDPVDLSTASGESVVLLIHSPGRVGKTADLLQQAGATAIQVVHRLGAESPRPFTSRPAPATRSRRRPATPPPPTMPNLPYQPSNQPNLPTQLDD